MRYPIMLLLFGMLLIVCTREVEQLIILLPEKTSEQESLAAREIRRYLYQRTDQLVEIVHSDSLPDDAGSLIVVGTPNYPVVSKLGIHLQGQEYLLKTTRMADRQVLLVLGGEDGGLLYGAYRFAEHLGVRFYLHGDVIPDEKIALTLPQLNEQRKPLFERRGIHPFHDFPEGPDWWNLDDYKAVLAQLPKMGMNFFALHTYPDNQPFEGEQKGPEPVVWIGQESDINPDGTVKYSSPARHMTTHTNTWGYAKMNTSDYHLGASLLFERDDFGADYMINRTPWPATAQDRNNLFNEFGKLLGDAFTFSHQLSVKTCVGTELTLTIPQVVKNRLLAQGKNPDDPATVREVYQGMFRWIEKNYPLDYYWLWTHEGWTWQGVSDAEVAATEADLQLAYQALYNIGKPFDMATCGWVLGPPKDRTQFDRILPKDVAFSAINRELGKEPVDRHFGAIQDRPTWAIPWLEDDPRMISPQLWAGRMRQDAVDALGYGCNGLLGIHWRTRTLAPTIAALAYAGWDQRWATAKQKRTFNEKNILTFATGEAVHIDAALEPPYATVREGAAAYHFKLPNGLYTVSMFFIEPTFAEPGKRVFSVRLQGDRPIEFYDIAQAVGKGTPTELTFDNVQVNDGLLVVDFMVKVGRPCVAGFYIRGEGQTLKLNCGAAEEIGDWLAEPQPFEPPSRDMPVDDFYLDWAKANFGAKNHRRIAAIFAKMDGHLHEPAQWINGPGGIQTFYVGWEELKQHYTFVDELAALRPGISGAGNLERFDYWLDVFQFMRGIARIGCTLGELESIIKTIETAGADERLALAREQALPARLRLTKEWRDMQQFLLSYVDTPGDFGTIANIEQHNWLALNLLHRHDEKLQSWLGEQLPQSAFLSQEYSGALRLIVPTKRTILQRHESLTVKALVLSESEIAGVTLYWRTLGTEDFSSQPLEHVNRGVYKAVLQSDDYAQTDFEYYIVAENKAGEKQHYPAAAPHINHTVVIL